MHDATRVECSRRSGGSAADVVGGKSRALAPALAAGDRAVSASREHGTVGRRDRGTALSDDGNVQRHCGRDGGARDHVRTEVAGDHFVRDRRGRQPVRAVCARPASAGRRQREARVPVALPGHQRRRRADRHAGRHRGQRLLAAHQERAVDVPVARAVAVLRPGFRLRGRRDGRRTVAGPHQTVVLPNRTYLHTHTHTHPNVHVVRAPVPDKAEIGDSRWPVGRLLDTTSIQPYRPGSGRK